MKHRGLRIADERPQAIREGAEISPIISAPSLLYVHSDLLSLIAPRGLDISLNSVEDFRLNKSEISQASVSSLQVSKSRASK